MDEESDSGPAAGSTQAVTKAPSLFGAGDAVGPTPSRMSILRLLLWLIYPAILFLATLDEDETSTEPINRDARESPHVSMVMAVPNVVLSSSAPSNPSQAFARAGGTSWDWRGVLQ